MVGAFHEKYSQIGPSAIAECKISGSISLAIFFFTVILNQQSSLVGVYDIADHLLCP